MSLEAAAAEPHRGLHAGVEGDLQREGARPDDDQSAVVKMLHGRAVITHVALIVFGEHTTYDVRSGGGREEGTIKT